MTAVSVGEGLIFSFNKKPAIREIFDAVLVHSLGGKEWLERQKSSSEPHPLYLRRIEPFTRTYWRTAYDVYTLVNNHTQKIESARIASLMRRLGSIEFFSSSVEITASAHFIRAGFNIAWEDDSRRGRDHEEFVAISPLGGRPYSVECKIPQPENGKPVPRGKEVKHVKNQIADALGKRLNHFVIAIIDMNAEALSSIDERRERLQRIRKAIDRWKALKDVRHLANGFVIVVDQAQVPITWQAETETLITWINFEDRSDESLSFDSLKSAHPDLHHLIDSMIMHSRVPIDYDGLY